MGNHVDQIECLLSFTFESIEAQLKTMHLLAKDERRREACEYTKRLLNSIILVIDAIESDVAEEIEMDADNLLQNSAIHVKFFGILKRNPPKLSVLNDLERRQTDRHKSFTSALALLERRSTTDARRRLELMKERAECLMRVAEIS